MESDARRAVWSVLVEHDARIDVGEPLDRLLAALEEDDRVLGVSVSGPVRNVGLRRFLPRRRGATAFVSVLASSSGEARATSEEVVREALARVGRQGRVAARLAFDADGACDDD